MNGAQVRQSRESEMSPPCGRSSGSMLTDLAEQARPRWRLSLLRKINNEAKEWLAPLDGLRALAALAVLGSHTALLPVPFGTLGVLLFFNLSAFLLSRPFLA